MPNPKQIVLHVNSGKSSLVDMHEWMRATIKKDTTDEQLNIPATKPDVYDSVFIGFIYKNPRDNDEIWARVYTPIYDKKNAFTGNFLVTEARLSDLIGDKKKIDAIEGAILNLPSRSIGEFRMLKELVSPQHSLNDDGYDSGTGYRFSYGKSVGRDKIVFPMGRELKHVNVAAQEPVDVTVSRAGVAAPISRIAFDGEMWTAKKAVKEIIEAPATDLSKVNPNDQIGFGKWLNGQMKEKFSNFDFSKLSKDDQKELVKHVSNLISNRLLASLAKAEPPAATERPPATTAQAPAEKPKRELSERELDNLLDELEAPDALKKAIPKPSGSPRIAENVELARRESAAKEARLSKVSEPVQAPVFPTEQELNADIRQFVNSLDSTNLATWGEASDVVDHILEQRKITVPLNFALREGLELYASNEITAHTQDVSPAVMYELEDLKNEVTKVVNRVKFDKSGQGASPSKVINEVLRQKNLGKDFVSQNDMKELSSFAASELVRRLNEVVVTTTNPERLKPEVMNLIKGDLQMFISTGNYSEISGATPDSVVRLILTRSMRHLVKTTGGITGADIKELETYVQPQLIARRAELVKLAAEAQSRSRAEIAPAVSTSRTESSLPPTIPPSEVSAQREAERQRQLAAEAERRRTLAPPTPAPAAPIVAPAVSTPIVSLSRKAVSVQDVAKSFTGSYTPGQLIELNRTFAEAPEARKYTSAYHVVYQKQSDDGSMLLFVKAHGGARIYRYDIPAGFFDPSSVTISSAVLQNLKSAGASNSEADAIAMIMTKSFVSNIVTGEVQSFVYANGGMSNTNYLSLGKSRDEYRIPKGTRFSRLITPLDFVKDFSAEDKRKYLAEPTENPDDYEVLGTMIAGTRAMIFKEHKSAMESAISSYLEGNPEPFAKLLLSYAMEGQATSAVHIQVLSVYLMYRLQQEGLMDFTGIYAKLNGKTIKPLKDAEDILKRARTKSGAQEVFAILQEWENRKVMGLGKEGAVSKLTEILNYANENFMAEKPPKGYSRSGKIYPYLKSRATKKVASEVNPVDGKLGPITLMAWMFVMTEPSLARGPDKDPRKNRLEAEPLHVADVAVFKEKRDVTTKRGEGSTYELNLHFFSKGGDKLTEAAYLKSQGLTRDQALFMYYGLMLARDTIPGTDGNMGWFIINPNRKERQDKNIFYTGFLDMDRGKIFPVTYEKDTAIIGDSPILENVQFMTHIDKDKKEIHPWVVPEKQPWEMDPAVVSRLYSVQSNNNTFFLPNYGTPSRPDKNGNIYPGSFIIGNGTIKDLTK
ncbi:MAG: hypothetical protein AABW86_04010 [Candidatus Micrarchaeota archaeon]